MIKRRPSKTEMKLVLSYKLALVVANDYERLVIGTEDEIRRRLSGDNSAVVFCDKVSVFGDFLLRSDPTPGASWKVAISNLVQAQCILHSNNPIDHFVTDDVLYYEQQAQDILAQKFDSEDPICQYVALRIWYGYWDFREKRKAEPCELYLESMQNLIRPFYYPRNYIEDGTRVTTSNAVFRHPLESTSYDKEQNIYHLAGATDIEYIMADMSLIPLEKYYITQFTKWQKYLVCCKNCGQYFFADTLKYELCSQECRDQARKKMLIKRKANEEIATIDRICLNASAHWYNRLKKIKESGEYGEERIRKFEAEKERFLKEKREKRKAYKHGEITFKELRDWLIRQEVAAQTALESLWLQEGDNG